MQIEKVVFDYTVFNDVAELPAEDVSLVESARQQTALAYAPYSKFQVSAVARLSNGQIFIGTNQENASFPVGICAERVLLGTIANAFPNTSIDTIAISYSSDLVSSTVPISPCGMCRQALAEYEVRTQNPIRLLLTGQSGQIFLIPKASQLLPLAFSPKSLTVST